MPAAPQFAFEVLLMLLLEPFIDLFGAWVPNETPLINGSIETGLTCASKFPFDALLCWAMGWMNGAETRMKKIAGCKIALLDIVIIFRCKKISITTKDYDSSCF